MRTSLLQLVKAPPARLLAAAPGAKQPSGEARVRAAIEVAMTTWLTFLAFAFLGGAIAVDRCWAIWFLACAAVLGLIALATCG